MAYVALYRRWRPTVFADVVGQQHVSRTLEKAIEQDRVGHAYLFAGPRGTGKTSTAKILAKALNCEKGPTVTPCNECESCMRVNDGTSMDVFEIDAASNRGIDEIRGLRETVKFVAADGKYKVYIIDEVHMLTSEAFNALLKTLEEPPSRVVFILATTEIHKVPATIQSRCQRYDFKRISSADIEARLRYVAANSGIEADDDALAVIAREADGGMRDALSTLDQCAALAETRVTSEVVREILGLIGREYVTETIEAIASRDKKKALSLVARLMAEGKDLRELAKEMILELRSVMVFQAAGKLDGVEMYETSQEMLEKEAKYFAPSSFMPMINRLHDALGEMRWTSEPRIAMETALLDLCGLGANENAAKEAAQNVPRSDAPTQGGGDARLSAIDSARIKEMESQIKGLMQKVAELEARPEAVVQAAATTTRKRTAKTAKASSRAIRPVEPPKVTPEGQKLWQDLLKSLSADEKYHIVHNCAAKGVFAGTSPGFIHLSFTSDFLRDRIERPDYDKIFAAKLMELTGKEMHVICEQPASPPPPPPPPPPKRPDYVPDMGRMSAEERKPIEKAVEFFGDEFIPLPDDKDYSPSDD